MNSLISTNLDSWAIAVEQLRKDYGKTAAVCSINFTVKAGEIFGLIGPDGAGKTTTFQILAGVMGATSGQVRVFGKAPPQARLGIGYLTQKFSLYQDLSIEENLRYCAGLRQVPDRLFKVRSAQLLKRFGLQPFSHRLASQLSGGMKQKLALCCALIAQPQVLLLDEPTTGVDPVSRREFWDLLAAIASEGVTIVIATPYLDEAERCHRIALIYAGKIQQLGTLGELRTNLGLDRIELRSPQLDSAATLLLSLAEKSHPVIVDVQTFGDRLDVLVSEPEEGIRQIGNLLADHNIRLDSLEANEPTLENVFVNQLRQQGVKLPLIPFPQYKVKQKNSDLSPQEFPQIAIGAYNLHKTFGDFSAVKGIDLEVKYGEIYGLLGANGAGKTTTIKMICGLLPPSSGKMLLAGETENLHRAEVRSRLGYMSQKFTLYDDLTIRQNLKFYCGVYGIPEKLHRAKIEWVLATCGLLGRENTLTGSLPGGWKQRVAFGASVMHEPEILFLDEPTSGVDPLARRQFWLLIRQLAARGTAVLVTTHYLEEAESCNRIGFMAGGQLVAQGTPSQIKSAYSGELIELVLSNLQLAAEMLKQQLEPWRVAIFGDRLHLVLDRTPQQLPIITQSLQKKHITIHCQRIIPVSLEDVFISIVQKSKEE
jgi:ABC-2 type transport system ATP-binding protein